MKIFFDAKENLLHQVFDAKEKKLKDINALFEVDVKKYNHLRSILSNDLLKLEEKLSIVDRFSVDMSERVKENRSLTDGLLEKRNELILFSEKLELFEKKTGALGQNIKDVSIKINDVESLLQSRIEKSADKLEQKIVEKYKKYDETLSLNFEKYKEAMRADIDTYRNTLLSEKKTFENKLENVVAQWLSRREEVEAAFQENTQNAFDDFARKSLTFEIDQKKKLDMMFYEISEKTETRMQEVVDKYQHLEHEILKLEQKEIEIGSKFDEEKEKSLEAIKGYAESYIGSLKEGFRDEESRVKEELERIEERVKKVAEAVEVEDGKVLERLEVEKEKSLEAIREYAESYIGGLKEGFRDEESRMKKDFEEVHGKVFSNFNLLEDKVRSLLDIKEEILSKHALFQEAYESFLREKELSQSRMEVEKQEQLNQLEAMKNHINERMEEAFSSVKEEIGSVSEDVKHLAMKNIEDKKQEIVDFSNAEILALRSDFYEEISRFKEDIAREKGSVNGVLETVSNAKENLSKERENLLVEIKNLFEEEKINFLKNDLFKVMEEKVERINKIFNEMSEKEDLLEDKKKAYVLFKEDILKSIDEKRKEQLEYVEKKVNFFSKNMSFVIENKENQLKELFLKKVSDFESFAGKKYEEMKNKVEKIDKAFDEVSQYESGVKQSLGEYEIQIKNDIFNQMNEFGEAQKEFQKDLFESYKRKMDEDVRLIEEEIKNKKEDLSKFIGYVKEVYAKNKEHIAVVDEFDKNMLEMKKKAQDNLFRYESEFRKKMEQFYGDAKNEKENILNVLSKTNDIGDKLDRFFEASTQKLRKEIAELESRIQAEDQVVESRIDLILKGLEDKKALLEEDIQAKLNGVFDECNVRLRGHSESYLKEIEKKIDGFDGRIFNDMKLYEASLKKKWDEIEKDKKTYLDSLFVKVDELTDDLKLKQERYNEALRGVEASEEQIKKMLAQYQQIEDMNENFMVYRQTLEEANEMLSKYMANKKEINEAVSNFERLGERYGKLSKIQDGILKKIERGSDRYSILKEKLDEMEQKAILFENAYKKISEFSDNFSNLEIAILDVEQRQRTIEKLKGDLILETQNLNRLKTEIDSSVRSFEKSKITEFLNNSENLADINLTSEELKEMVYTLYKQRYSVEKIAEVTKKSIFEVQGILENLE